MMMMMMIALSVCDAFHVCNDDSLTSHMALWGDINEISAQNWKQLPLTESIIQWEDMLVCCSILRWTYQSLMSVYIVISRK